MPSSIDELQLQWPPLWEHDWDKLVSDSQGVEARVYASQHHLALLLKEVHRSPATPEKLGWLGLWSRLYTLLSAGLGVWSHRARSELLVLERVHFDVGDHIRGVLAPLTRGTGESELSAIRDRFRAYFAWCLWNDTLVYRDLLLPEHLDAMFDPEPSRALLADLGSNRDTWEAFTGQKLELRSEQEAGLDRRKAAESYGQQLALLDMWLRDSRLRPWTAKLEKNPRSTLRELLGGPKGVRGGLRATDLGFAYAAYQRGSGAVHGSSAEAAFLMHPPFVAPDCADFLDAATEVLSHVVTGTNLLVMPLYIALRAIEPGAAGT